MQQSDFIARVLPAWASPDMPRPQPMDESTFKLLYAETAPKLRAYIRRATSNWALADDLLQETFYRFLRANLPILENGQMKAYLYRTAHSLVVDYWRRANRESRWSFANWSVSERTESLQNVGIGTMDAFARLKPQEQSLLWLAYVEGFDHREIASALQLKKESVRVLLFRARKRLARMIKKQGFAGEETL